MKKTGWKDLKGERAKECRSNMVLENILRLARLENDARELVKAVNKNPHVNVVAAINEVERKHGAKELFGKETGYTPEQFEEVLSNPIKAKSAVIGWYETNHNTLVEGAERNYVEIAEALRKDKNAGLKIGQAVLNLDNKLYTKKNKLADAHKKAREAIDGLKEPEKAIEAILKNYRINTVGNGVISLIEGNPKFLEGFLIEETKKAQEEFYKVFENAGEARKYLDEIYNTADEKTRKEIAYHAAVALATEGEARSDIALASEGKTSILRPNFTAKQEEAAEAA